MSEKTKKPELVNWIFYNSWRLSQIQAFIDYFPFGNRAGHFREEIKIKTAPVMPSSLVTLHFKEVDPVPERSFMFSKDTSDRRQFVSQVPGHSYLLCAKVYGFIIYCCISCSAKKFSISFRNDFLPSKTTQHTSWDLSPPTTFSWNERLPFMSLEKLMVSC